MTLGVEVAFVKCHIDIWMTDVHDDWSGLKSTSSPNVHKRGKGCTRDASQQWLVIASDANPCVQTSRPLRCHQQLTSLSWGRMCVTKPVYIEEKKKTTQKPCVAFRVRDPQKGIPNSGNARVRVPSQTKKNKKTNKKTQTLHTSKWLAEMESV